LSHLLFHFFLPLLHQHNRQSFADQRVTPRPGPGGKPAVGCALSVIGAHQPAGQAIIAVWAPPCQGARLTEADAVRRVLGLVMAGAGMSSMKDAS